MSFSFGQFDEFGIEIEQNQKIGQRVIRFRNMFFRLFVSRMYELLPLTFEYNDSPQSIDWIRVECALRNGFNVIIGQDNKNFIRMLGYTQNPSTITNPENMWLNKILRSHKDQFTNEVVGDIRFIIPKDDIPYEMREIEPSLGSNVGNFVVIRNKPVNYVNDFAIIHHYAEHLAEITASRYSLAIQTKIKTFLAGEEGDETLNQLAVDLYNGEPVTKVTKLFDKDDQILTYGEIDYSKSLTPLFDEYKNVLSNLLTMLGLDTLPTQKASGMTQIEALKDNPFSSYNSNIYYAARKSAVDRLNYRFGLDIKVNLADIRNSVMSQLQAENMILGVDG